MHTSTKALKELMDPQYFATFEDLESKGGFWTHDEECDTFHFEGKPLVLLFDMPWLDQNDFEVHPDFEALVYSK